MRLKHLLIVLIVVLGCAIGALPGFCADATPHIFWVSQPVAPGQTILMQGGPLEKDATVSIETVVPSGAKGAAAGKARVLLATESAVQCVVPKAFPLGIYSVTVKTSAGESAPVLVNAPEAQWVQGDGGESASPGGWLRVQGRCMAMMNDDRKSARAAPRVRITFADGSTREIPAAVKTGYSLEAAVPKDAPVGAAKVAVHNGFGGANCWSRPLDLIIRNESWPTDVFRVGGTRENDIRAALDKARANKGGVVLLPAGEYRAQLLYKFEVPPRTVIRGEGPDNTRIELNDYRAIEDPDEAVFYGTEFAIEDMSICVSGYYRDLIKVDGGSRLRCRNLILRAVQDLANWAVKDGPGTVGGRGRICWVRPRDLGNVFAVEDSSNVEIVDCDVYATLGKVFSLRGVRNLLVRDCKLWRAYYYTSDVTNAIVENTGTFMLVNPHGNCNGFYFAGNVTEHRYVNDRMLFSTDVGFAPYLGRIDRVDGATLWTAEDVNASRYQPNKPGAWAGYMAMIMDGRGAGQVRFVKQNDGRKFVLNAPWDVAPDKSSVLSIVFPRTNFLMIDNAWRDGGVLQFYGTIVGAVVEGNVFERCQGLGFWPRDIHDSWQCAMRGEFTNNIFRKPLTHHWGRLMFRADCSYVSKGYDGPLGRASVFRSNVMDGATWGLAVGGGHEDVLVEDNSMRNQPVGIAVSKRKTARGTVIAPAGVVLRGNSMDNVNKPYDGDALDQATRVDN